MLDKLQVTLVFLIELGLKSAEVIVSDVELKNGSMTLQRLFMTAIQYQMSLLLTTCTKQLFWACQVPVHPKGVVTAAGP